MMAVMTVQPPLPLAPNDARPVGAAAAIVEDGDGGRVFVHGNLAYAWDVGDTAARRFAAVSLMRIKAATQLEVAEAFAVKPASVRRWESWLTDSGVAGLLGERKGPKRKSKLTADTVAAIQCLRDGGASYRAIAAETGVSEGSVRNALVLADHGARTEKACLATTSDAPPEPEPEPEPEGEPEGEPDVEKDCSAAMSDDPPAPVQVPVLADPVDRGAERAWAAFGLIPYAPPVFTGCARAPLAGLFLALPALTATGLLDTAHTVYGELPNGFYSLDTMLCESVFRALLGQARAQGATRIDPPALGRSLGLDRAPEVKTIRRKIRLLAEAGKAGEWIAAMARRHVQGRPEQAAVCYVDGHVRAYQGTRRIAKTHVPRLKFPAPATVETWVADAAGDPLLVVMAEPAASLAAELRRLIPDLRDMVGDDRRVLVGFDRGGWSPALFADLVGINGVPILIEETQPARVVDIVTGIASSFGAIQLEDFAAPECFEIEQVLRVRLQKPVLHDDQHGTAVVALAALINAARQSGVELTASVVGQIGLGAAGTGIVRLLRAYGVQHVLGTDLNAGAVARLVAAGGQAVELEALMQRADIVIATTGVKGLIRPQWVRKGQVILALSNPDAEIEPLVAREQGAAFAADGKGINNVLAFPGLFKGALAARARCFSDAMLMAAANAIAGAARADELVPDPLDKELHEKVTAAVRAAAQASAVD